MGQHAEDCLFSAMMEEVDRDTNRDAHTTEPHAIADLGCYDTASLDREIAYLQMLL